MILWNRNRAVTKRLTSDDRRDIAEEICTKDLFTAMEIIDIAINVLTPLALLWVFKLNSISFNLLAFAIAFCVFDIVMCIVDHLVIVVIPRNKTLSISFTKAQERLDKIQHEDYLKRHNIYEFLDIKCPVCGNSFTSYQKERFEPTFLKIECNCHNCKKAFYGFEHSDRIELWEERNFSIFSEPKYVIKVGV